MSNAGQQLANLQAGGGRVVSTTGEILPDGITKRTTYVVEVDHAKPDGSMEIRQEIVTEDKPTH